MSNVDILIRDGRVIDPSRNIDRIEDIGIKNGKIVDLCGFENANATYEVNAKGKYVLPGLIDFHAHVFYTGSDFCVPPDSFAFACGTTTIVDAGSSGVANYLALRLYINSQKIRIKSLLNVCNTGLGTLRIHENLDPATWNIDAIKETFLKYKDNILGLKVRQSKEIVGALGLNPLKETLKIASDIRCPTVVHVTNPPEREERIAELLGKGDVFCHVFHGTGHTIIEDGKVHPAIWEARERGVLFDASNGRGHFSFEVAQAAINDGFLPDILSTDITINTLFKDYVFGLPYLMAKYLCLGVDIKDIIRMVTYAPAQAMQMDHIIGTLSPGANADVSIFSLEDMHVAFKDTQGNIMHGDKMFIPEMTILNGDIVFRKFSFL